MSRRPHRAFALAAVALLLLTGCAGDARGDLRRAVAELTASANSRDAAGVRRDADTVISRLEAALRAGDVSPEQATTIRERTLAVRAAADEIDPAVIARREAEQAEAEERERLEAEREAAARAELERLEQERQQAEEEARRAEEERQRVEEEEARRAEEERQQAEEEEDDDDEDDASPSPSPGPRGTGSASPTPTAAAAQ